MTQERFSTLEECCEFVRLFSQLAEQKSKEEINNDVIAMHIALTKHIDEYVNRVCARHELKCSVALNYRMRSLGGCYYRTCFIELNPELLFYGANYFREAILHELAHLTNKNHKSNFWRTHIAYLQEEGLLPQGKILESQVIKLSNTVSYKSRWHFDKPWWSKIKPSIQLTLNGEPIVDLYSHNKIKDLYGTYFHMHNPSLCAKLSVDGLQQLQTVKIMRAIIRKAIKQQLNINIMA